MRRVLIVGLIGIGGLIVSFALIAGFFFLITVIFLDEQAMDFTITPAITCKKSVGFSVDVNNVIYVEGKNVQMPEAKLIIEGLAKQVVITEKNIDGVNVPETNLCIFILGNARGDQNLLAEINDYSNSLGLHSSIATLSN